jgi:hypothetical protein
VPLTTQTRFSPLETSKGEMLALPAWTTHQPTVRRLDARSRICWWNTSWECCLMGYMYGNMLYNGIYFCYGVCR